MRAQQLGDLASREAGAQKRPSRGDGLDMRHTEPPVWTAIPLQVLRQRRGRDEG
jgi:hypothetical protein